jgi:glycosyltransferase involved in cell wall biosynthesis
MIRISVIIPCYNVAPFIENCIASVRDQTRKPLEIICVNNNSTDETQRILQEFEANGQVTVVNEKKQNASAARNKGLSMASGDWIQFLDADDVLYPDKLERQSAMIRPESKLIVGAYDMSINNGPKVHFTVQKSDPWSLLINSGIGNTVSNLWKKNMLLEVGAWNENYDSSQEYELLFRVLKAIEPSEIVFDEKASMLYNRRINDSISNRYEKNTINRIKLRKTFKDHFLQSSFPNRSQLIAEVQNFIIKDLRFLYTLNKNKALELFSLCIDRTFTPQNSFVTPWYYNALYRIFGFELTESVSAWKRKFRTIEKEHHF